MPGTMSVDGLISGLNTQDIITKLVDMRKQAVKRLEDKKTKLNDKLTAWQELNTRMLALRLKTDALTNPNTFASKTVVSDNESAITATAGSEATTGTYYIKVKSVALAHQMQSQGYNDMSAQIGTGTVKITVAGKETSISLDGNNGTLVGLKDAINRAGAGVKAAIIDTGQTDGRYKLIVTSDSTGKANEMKIDLAGLAGGTTPAFTDLQAATNAELEIGSGAGAIQVSKPSNTIDDLLPGVSLKIKTADTNKIIKLDVQRNDQSIKDSINGFIEQYNNVLDYVNQQFKYDQASGATGTLFGDFSLMVLQSDLTSITSNPVGELSQSVKILSQIGIKADSSGKLSLDETAFQKALDTNVDDVKSLFAATGSTSDSSLQYVASTKDTRVTASGYEINVTRVATKSYVTAGVALSGNLAAAETLTINGKDVALDAGMSPSKVVETINARTKELGVTASLTDVAGQKYLTLSSNFYGANGDVTVKSGLSSSSGVTSGFGNVLVKSGDARGESGSGSGNRGVDVAGTINGKAATGSGQVLTSSDGDSKGMRVLVSGGTTGVRGKVYFSRGVGAQLSQFVTASTEKLGVLGSAQDTINKQIGDIGNEITDLNARLEKKEQQLYEQFQSMETALSKLKDQGSSLSSLIAGMVK